MLFLHEVKSSQKALQLFTFSLENIFSLSDYVLAALVYSSQKVLLRHWLNFTQANHQIGGALLWQHHFLFVRLRNFSFVLLFCIAHVANCKVKLNRKTCARFCQRHSDRLRISYLCRALSSTCTHTYMVIR